MKSLCAELKLRMDPLCDFRAYLRRFIRETNMLDLVYLGLGAVLFVVMGFYARACGRL